MRTKFSFITFNFSLGSFGTHRKGKIRISKYEIRNTKQIQITKISMTKTADLLLSEFSHSILTLFRIS